MPSVRNTWNLAQVCARRFSQTAARRSEEVTEVTTSRFNALKETQKKFQVDDGIPSYLKGGLGDKVLLQITLLLTGIGLVMSSQVLFKLAVPSKE